MTARGFSLIEALVALVVLTVGLLGVSALLISSLREQSQALRHQVATRLVADVAERLRATGQEAPTDLPDFTASAAQSMPGLAPETSITRAPATGAATPAQFRVRLRWRDTPDAEAADVSLVVIAGAGGGPGA